MSDGSKPIDGITKLPLFERRRDPRFLIGGVLVDTKHVPALVTLELDYWFVGNRRPKSKSRGVLRGLPIRSWCRDGQQHNIQLHRVIALAKRDDKLPQTMQELVYELQMLSPVSLRDPHAPYDLRECNIVFVDAGRRSSRRTYDTDNTNDPRDSFIAPATTDDIRSIGADGAFFRDEQLATTPDGLVDVTNLPEGYGPDEAEAISANAREDILGNIMGKATGAECKHEKLDSAGICTYCGQKVKP